MGSSSKMGPQGSVKREEQCTEEELQRAERLGSAWLERYRRIEGSSLLPSVEPLNELLLGLDFFADLREEDVRSLAAGNSVVAKAVEPTAENVDGAPPGISEEEIEDEGSLEDGNDALGKGATIDSRSPRGYGDHLRAIPTVLRNENQYVGFFLPLFLQEAKQALARAIKLDLGPAEEFVQVSVDAYLTTAPEGTSNSLVTTRSSIPHVHTKRHRKSHVESTV